MAKSYEEKQIDSINDIEKQLANARLINLKNKIFYNLGKGVISAEKVIPYILITSISLTAFSGLFSIPFYREERKSNTWSKKQIDSNGTIVVEEQYQNYRNDNEMSYVGKWEETANGFYERNIITYEIKSLSEEDIKRILQDDNISLDDLLGSPIYSKKEKKNNLTLEELNSDPYVVATIYSKEKNSYVYIKENARYNSEMTLLFILFTLVANGMYAIYNSTKDHDLIDGRLRNLQKKYAPIDIECLTRKLSIRKETYSKMHKG